jgi:hypothetical protein
MQGHVLRFEEHDTLLCGRSSDCHVNLKDDQQISRNHFLLEVNPPDIRIRDLGSRNGTYINGQKYGGREKGETPEEGARRQYPQVDLQDGDTVRAGKTHLLVKVDGIASATVRCQMCGKDVTAEVAPGHQGDYFCTTCGLKAQSDPIALLYALLRQAQASNPTQKLQIPDYQVVRKLGAGGMGDVYLVRHTQNNQLAALKIMLSRIAVNDKSRQEFQREIAATQALRHPNVVTFLDSGSQGSIFYFLIEYCDGGSLDQWLKTLKRPLTLQEAKPVMLQALEGLAYVHEQGFVHRDVKPHNILLGGPASARVAKIADLGLAKSFTRAGYSGMTATGSYAGSFPFMPREQVINFKFVKPVSDVWSLGATYYCLLTGRFCRDHSNTKDPLEAILQGDIIPIRQRLPKLPKEVADVIEHSLQIDVNQRYQNGREMLTDLTNALSKV